MATRLDLSEYRKAIQRLTELQRALAEETELLVATAADQQ